jgi:endoglycosylceramidase
VYTLLDMHQDVYNEVFRGEGAPAWAVCTDPEPVLAVGGRWSANYGNPALEVAFNHFWTNDVAGDLQGEYDRVWAAVARSFSNDPWIVGYDPYNEPFARVVTFDRSRVFGTLLECFYTGTAHPGRIERADPPLACPPGDPRQGIIPTIEKADPHHLVFVEPDNYSVGGRSSLLGPMPFPRLVLQFHSYCGARSPVTGDPTDLVACADQITDTMLRHNNQRAVMTSVHQPGGPPLFLGEFGATGSTALIDQVTRDANLLDLGWAYWTWKSYADPTGSSNEALMSPGGQLAPTAAVLSRPYAQAVAGTPTSSSFDPPSMRFRLTYVPIRSLAPSVIFVPVSSQYQNGYCASAVGGRIVSERDASHLLVKNLPRARQVTVVVTTGPCGRTE